MFQASILKGNCSSDCPDKVEITSTAVSFLYKLHFKHNQQKEILTFFATDTWQFTSTNLNLFYFFKKNGKD